MRATVEIALAPPPNLSALSGASSFACVRTRVKPTEPVSVMVAVTPLEKAKGTSTPGVLRPSLRTYSTRYCVIVMALTGLGPGPPLSFIRTLKLACPTSVKIDPVSLTTSDSTVVSLCGPPVRVVITRYDDDGPVRMAWLHDAAASSVSTTNAASAMRAPHTALVRFSVVFRSMVLPSQNPRRDEDQQFAARVRQRIALEQPLENRQPVQHGRAVVRAGFRADEDAADDRRRAVIHLHGRESALCVDRRDAADFPAEVRRRVFKRDVHDHRVRGRDLRCDLQLQRRVLERDRDRVVRHGLNRDLHALGDFRRLVIL